MHKLQPSVPTNLIPYIQVIKVSHFTNSHGQTNTVPFPSTKAFLHDPSAFHN